MRHMPSLDKGPIGAMVKRKTRTASMMILFHWPSKTMLFKALLPMICMAAVAELEFLAFPES